MAFHARVLILVFMLVAAIAGAQPSPIGPPLPSPAATGELSVSILTNLVRNNAQMTVDRTNAGLAQEGKGTRVSIESLTAHPPTRLRTEFPNKPNSWYAGIAYGLNIKVAIPNSFDRHIHIPIDVQTFCENWFMTGGGNVTVRAVPGPASIEGGNILEDVIHVRDLIDSRVRSAFSAPLPVSVTLAARCTTIGPFSNGTATVDDDTVKWDIPRPRPPVADTAARPMIVVTFDRLKRLRARRSPGNEILYSEVEQFALRAFGNYTEAFKELTMREGDDVALQLPPIRLDPRTFDLLVVIGNIDQPPNNPKDSAFAVATKAQNYGRGAHVLQIPKWYSVLNPDTHKPQFFSVPAYELRYTVQFDPGVVSTRP